MNFSTKPGGPHHSAKFVNLARLQEDTWLQTHDQIHHSHFSMNDKGAAQHLRRFSVNDTGADDLPDQHLCRFSVNDKDADQHPCRLQKNERDADRH